MSKEAEAIMVLRGQVYAPQVMLRAVAESSPISAIAAHMAEAELKNAGGNTAPSFLAGVEDVKTDIGHFVFQGGVGQDRVSVL